MHSSRSLLRTPSRNERYRRESSVSQTPMAPTVDFMSHTSPSGVALGQSPPLQNSASPSLFHYSTPEQVDSQWHVAAASPHISMDPFSMFGETQLAPSASPFAAGPALVEPSTILPAARRQAVSAQTIRDIRPHVSPTQEALVSAFDAHPMALSTTWSPMQSTPVVERSGCYTEVVYNERGESLLVCPCGDTFSLQRGGVEDHYDKKHVVDEGCPWRVRGCTNRAQDVKGHIRERHCLTYFTCRICLRSDFCSQRSMKKHAKACKNRETGFVFCGKCKSPSCNRAALVMHAASCVDE